MTGPALVVFAYSGLGHACLKLLIDRGENIRCVYTHEDSPSEKIWFASVAALAKEHGIPVRTEENLETDSELERLRSFSPDLILSFYYRNLIPDAVLALAKLGAYNMHGSLLPKYRGRAPINWAVLKGEKETGATLHVMVRGADAGDIVDQEAVAIGPDETAAEVQANVTRAAEAVLARQIDNLKKGAAPRKPQDASKASKFGRRRPEDGAIDWNWPARQVHDLVRAVTHPYPGAHGLIGGKKVLIWKTKVSSERSKAADKPGTSFGRGSRFYVVCGRNTLIEILEKEI